MSKEDLKDNTREDLLKHGVSSMDLDFGDIAAVISSGRWFILFFTLISSTLAFLYAKTLPDEYRSEAILTSATSSGSGGLMGSLGGVASLTGINLGISNQDDKVNIAIALLQTWSFLETFISQNKLELEVMAAYDWNNVDNQLLIDPAVYNQSENKWLVGNNINGKEKQPSSWAMYLRIKNRISILRDTNTGFVTLSVTHYSPHVAKKWVDLLIVAINKQIQAADKRDAEKSITYLKKQINEIDISDMRSVFYQLIEEQTKKLMLAEVREEYVFKTLSEAKVAEIRSKPNRIIITVIGFLIGCSLSVCVLFIRFALRSKRTGSNFSGKNYDN